MKNKIVLIISMAMVFASSLVFTSCKQNNGGQEEVAYDRAEMLNNLADNYIIPAYENYLKKIQDLKTSMNSFVGSKSQNNLDSLRSNWRCSLLAWQEIAFLEFGPADDISLRAQTNLFPTDTVLINSNIGSGSYNLEVFSNYDAKGLQAIDYLLNIPKYSDVELLSYYSSNSNAISYLEDLVDDLLANASTVKTKWASTYILAFKASNTSNGQGSSVSNVLNAINVQFETFIRKGKLGLPAGKFNGFSGDPMPEHVEAYYSGDQRAYMIRSLDALKKFIYGNAYADNAVGEGFDDYLDHLKKKKDNENLSIVISNHFALARTEIEGLSNAWDVEVQNNKDKVSAAYTEVQKIVPLLKVDLTSALGVLITYQDSDGD